MTELGVGVTHWPHHKVVAALRALLELAPCMSEDDRERTQALLAVLERRALPHEKQLIRDSLATLQGAAKPQEERT